MDSTPNKTVQHIVEEDKKIENLIKAMEINDIFSLKDQISYSDKNSLPPESGVYFVADNATIHYIGQAKNIRNRIKGHHLSRYFRNIEKARIIWICLPQELLNIHEHSFIKHFLPSLNDVSYNAFYSSTLKIEKLPKDIYKKVMAKGGSDWIRQLVIKTIQAEEEQLIIPTIEEQLIIPTIEDYFNETKHNKLI
ncbi:MAG: GIY-YIG nuclease family protein [Dolichospermum sp.]